MTTRTAFGAVGIFFLAASGALAAVPTDLRVNTFSDSLIAPPTAVVTFHTGLLKLTNLGFGVSVFLEWTANGQPMPPDLAGRAECVYGAAPKQYSCEALRNWFQEPPGGRRQYISEHESLQAFRLRNLEFGTDYCFRVRGGFNGKPYDDWTPWVCGRTQPAPRIPPKPAAPDVSVLPAASGRGELGAGQPLRVLVEWQSTGSNLAAWYAVEVWDAATKGWLEAAKRVDPLATLEQAIPYTADTAPNDDRWYSYRVCAGNIAGKACSDPSRTPQELWRAAKGKAGRIEVESQPVRAQGRVRLPSETVSNRRPLAICDAAREARARNSPAAPGLEARCKAQGEQTPIDFDGLAAKGEAVAAEDPLATELRNLQTEGPARLGFDIGMGAAEGQTAPGPGKQRIHDALSPAEQPGFVVALTFSLDRNRNVDMAATGAAIAQADDAVASARRAQPDPLYWLGFDIATGIFGDPALGALGNTATGPGSLKIRDGLSAAGQRGFNAAVAFHLSRQYGR